MDLGKFAAAHLDLRLAALNRVCYAAASTQQADAAQLDRPDLAERAITDRQMAVLLQRVDRFVTAPVRAPVEPAMSAADLAVEAELRTLAHDAGAALPLDTLSDCYGLTELDRQALVAVVAPELERAYERLYAYLCDEFDRRHPCVELLLTLTQGLEDRHVQRIVLGPYGTLRRCRLLLEHGTAASDLRQQLRLAPGVLEFLLGAPVDVRSIGQHAAADVAGRAGEVACEPHPVTELAAALAAGVVDIVGVWGRRDVAGAAAEALAAALGASLQQVPTPTVHDPERLDAALRAAAITAGTAGGLLWLPLDSADDPPPGLLDAAAAVLEATREPIVVTAVAPWRPIRVLAHRRWVETRARQADLGERVEAWKSRHPGLTDHEATGLAARFRLTPDAAAAASMFAVTDALVRGGDPSVSVGALKAACATVSTPRPDRLVSVLDPRRGPNDLVLPGTLHRQVLEIAAFARSLPELTDRWGAHRPAMSQRGLKALFTGDPGTGKTLAAEVIAGILGVQLIKIDLSRVVSKWVGETAKHLDAVFRLADGSSSVLFFDEADALFGKRGEVRHGTDRYANTEVSHLLQRFEEHDGLVILASNLRDHIDPAFTRRFHTVLHFPRPAEPERRRLWELVLPGCDGVDLAALAALDLTGAGIVGAARTAALLAAAAGSARPAMTHLAQSVARQFRGEGRLAPPADLAALAGAVGSRR